MAAACSGLLLAGTAAGVVLINDGDSTRVTAGPAASAVTTIQPATSTVTTVPPPPPPGVSPSTVPSTDVVVGTGATIDGVPWRLLIGGPSGELCLEVGVDHRTGSGCTGRPAGEPLPPEDRYVPLVFNNGTISRLVFGRAPRGITEVQLQTVRGTDRPSPVLPGTDDAYCVLHADQGPDRPTAVIGIRPDGTTLRLPIASKVVP
jgi:hypothetical protein